MFNEMNMLDSSDDSDDSGLNLKERILGTMTSKNNRFSHRPTTVKETEELRRLITEKIEKK
jgi:hypothetical protein